MNIVDVIVLLICAAAAFRGFRRGLLGQGLEFGGGFLGLAAGVALGPRVADAFTESSGASTAIISLIVVFVCLSAGQTVGFLLGHRFGKLAKDLRVGPVDQTLGAAFGIVFTLVAFWLIGSLLIQGPSRDVSRALSRSSLLRTMNDTLPEPPDVLAYLRQYLDTSGFPRVFADLPPPAGEPVKLPSKPVARSATRKAKAETVRINAPACNGTQLGSGWIAAPETVVTNAHVVAGADSVEVEELDSSFDATVVVYDPDTDVAVLHVEGLAGSPLELVSEEQQRGTGGATLGYPGGGELEAHPAAVQTTLTARGYDIYGRDTVSRRVYELRANVRKGSSGGPFVLPDGSVAGVIFAASTTEPGIGYALTGEEVVDDIELGSRRTSAVSTGDCTR